jgi:hypothetical protein
MQILTLLNVHFDQFQVNVIRASAILKSAFETSFFCFLRIVVRCTDTVQCFKNQCTKQSLP